MSTTAEKDQSHVDPDEKQFYNGSTSSSTVGSPTSTTVPPLFQLLQVEICEYQRWFPIIGWATSRLLNDPPNFTLVRPRDAYHYGSPVSDAVKTFHQAVEEALTDQKRNSTDGDAVRPLNKSTLPEGYEWSGFWTVRMKHPRGVDRDGWRYAKNFEEPVRFKKTPTPTCTARYRVWTRQVSLSGGPAVKGERDSDEVEELQHAEDLEHYSYLLQRQKEMAFASALKEKQRDYVNAGNEWTAEMEVEFEKKLREFSKSATTRENSVDNNPFGPTDDIVHFSPTAEVISTRDDIRAEQSGAVAASMWAAEHGDQDEDEKESLHYSAQRAEEEKLRYSFTKPQDMSDFIEQADHPTAVDGLQTESTVNRFVSTERYDDVEEEAVSPADNASNKDDFDSIFKKFCE
ncbi:hypothetical protein, conserved [Angomonas deanei]|uniref:Uncharacterized protein n=1 Tax=Angomonas deanei TaxID=59799 RepID=A0A7G2CBB0_9TRYP|nr:hypothetical protein, conserved [Angomonas deanei]